MLKKVQSQKNNKGGNTQECLWETRSLAMRYVAGTCSLPMLPSLTPSDDVIASQLRVISEEDRGGKQGDSKGRKLVLGEETREKRSQIKPRGKWS